MSSDLSLPDRLPVVLQWQMNDQVFSENHSSGYCQRITFHLYGEGARYSLLIFFLIKERTNNAANIYNL